MRMTDDVMFQITHYNHVGPARAAILFFMQEVTMVRTMRLCFADPDTIRTQAFLLAHSSGGLWSLLARECYPSGFLGVRIFGSRETPGMFALIETWSSNDSLQAARRTPAFPVLERFRHNLSLFVIDCGAFREPTERTDDRVRHTTFAQEGTATPVTELCAPGPESDSEARGDSAHHTRTRARLQPVEAFYEISDLPLHLDLSVQRRDP